MDQVSKSNQIQNIEQEYTCAAKSTILSQKQYLQPSTKNATVTTKPQAWMTGYRSYVIIVT